MPESPSSDLPIGSGPPGGSRLCPQLKVERSLELKRSPLQRRHTSQPHLGLKLLYHAPKVRPVHGGEGAPASLRVGQARPFESQKCRFPASFNLPIPEVDPCRITETPVRLRYGSKGWPQFLPHRSREKLWLRQRDRLPPRGSRPHFSDEPRHALRYPGFLAHAQNAQ